MSILNPVRNPSASFVRPNDATAYTSGDLIANSTTAGSVAPMVFQVSRSKDGSFTIKRARVKKSTASVTTCTVRIHLYLSAPTVTNGDNGAWVSTHAGYLGFIDIIVDKAFSDAAGGEGVPIYSSQVAEMLIKLAGSTTSGAAGVTTIWGLLEARSAYTPGAQEVFTVTLEADPIT